MPNKLQQMSGQQGFSYKVEIVMCIDATGSMGKIIDKVKKNALMIYHKFMDEMNSKGKRADWVRIKVIAFRDYGYDDVPMQESKFFNLPDENEEFESFVRNIKAEGGGDPPENALEAIATAIKSDWVATGVKKRQVILVFTDAAALEFNERSDYAGYPSGMPKDLAELGEWWAGITKIGTYDKKAGRLVVFAPPLFPWNTLSWNRYWYSPVKSDGGLDEIEIDTAIRLLVSSISDVAQ